MLYIRISIVILLWAHIAFSTVLKKEDLLEENLSTTVKTLLQQTTELQIGGTHTYGNKTTIKSGDNRGDLDPKILIINPDSKAHDMSNPNVISIMGSGFDLELLDQLFVLCDSVGHRFQKIYINNILPLLPIPDQQVQYLKHQNDFIQTGAVPANVPLLELNLYLYYQNLSDKNNLYKRYVKLLHNKGLFIFKSAGLSRLGMVLSTGLYSLMKSDLDPLSIEKTFSGSVDEDYYRFNNEDAQNLFNNARNKLSKIGEYYYYDFNDIFQKNELFSNIIVQMKLLKKAGFSVNSVAVARLKDWGYEKSQSAYSIIINASAE